MSAPGEIWSREAPAKLVERIRRLTPEGAPSWGNLAAAAMIVHLSDQLRMALGEIPLGPPRGWLRFEPLRTLVVHWLPWPKGRAKAPREAFTTTPSSWQTDLEALLALLERFSQARPETLSLSHPTFGRMSPRDWGTLSYRHFDHHLRQFRC